MKIWIIGIILLATISSGQKNDFDLEYIAQTRGLYLQITINSKRLGVVGERGGSPRQRLLKDSELKELTALLQNTVFENASNLQADKSTYDAAARANLAIVYKKKTHQFTFDHGQPPSNLKAFVNKIITLSEIVD